MARAKKNKPESKKKVSNGTDLSGSDLSMFDRAAKNIFSILDNGYNNRELLNAKDQKFRSILNRELEISKGVSQGSIIDFVSSLKISDDKNNIHDIGAGNRPDTNELFTKNINDIFGYFQEMYKNKFLEMSDLKFIAKFIPALGEAVKTVLDSVVSSDNIAETVNRTIDLPPSIEKDDKVAIMSEIERYEDELKLLDKLKNVVYKKALVTGTHYVYVKDYNSIFAEYEKIKKETKRTAVDNERAQFSTSKKKKATESIMIGDIDYTSAMESITNLVESSSNNDGKKLSKSEVSNIVNNIKDELPEVTCEQSNIYSSALESAYGLYESDAAMEAFKAKKQRNATRNKVTPLEVKIPDGTKSINYKPKDSVFSVPGVYLKYLDPKNVIPLRLFDEVIGYYIIHQKAKKRKSSVGEVSGINSIGNTLFSAVNVGEAKKNDAVQKIIDTISQGIMDSFSSKFVSKNAKYKKLIADCIIANGLVDSDYNIQFIPADDIIAFTIQENEEGLGESILTDSLFPAKLLLSMLVTKILNYINKTGNKRIAHIHKNNVNAFDNNQLNRVIRDIQDEDITFNDLLSPNLVFNKFNRDGNLAIPTSKNGEKLVEFEIQEGQNIDMSPEFEKMLEQMAIIGTGVPTVIMEYAGSADFAKQLVSANIKYAGRVSTIQSDLENPTTLLYKKICEFSTLTDEQKTICAQNLEIKLPRPRVLTNSNNNDYIQSVVQTAEAIADAVIGRETVSNQEVLPNGPQIKDKVMYSIVKKNAPFVDWDEIDDIVKQCIIDVNGDVVKKELEKSSNSSDDGGGNPF